jgi:hypothetical protein
MEDVFERLIDKKDEMSRKMFKDDEWTESE